MSTVQKFVGPDHKISIHEDHNGNWELALIDAHSDTIRFFAAHIWARSEDGEKLLYLNSQVDDEADIIHCVRIDQLPKLLEAARRYALAHRQPTVDVKP